jgi:hypothetical protein
VTFWKTRERVRRLSWQRNMWFNSFESSCTREVRIPVFGVVYCISDRAGRVELCGHKLSLCSINNSADKQKSAPPVGKYFSWTKQLWISPGFCKKMRRSVHEPFSSLLSCGMNTTLCVLTLLEIIHDLLASDRLLILLQELIPLSRVLVKLMATLLLKKCAESYESPPHPKSR